MPRPMAAHGVGAGLRRPDAYFFLTPEVTMNGEAAEAGGDFAFLGLRISLAPRLF